MNRRRAVRNETPHNRRSVTQPKPINDPATCSFCGKTQKEVKKLIAGPAGVPANIYICDACVDLCNVVIEKKEADFGFSPEPAPIPMRLQCPECHALHIDEGAFATKKHHTHACQNCGAVWRPAIVCTVGVQFLPGFKNDAG